MAVDWILVQGHSKTIGAIGFVDGQALTVIAFFDDRDGNKDGNVSWGEWLASKVSPISIEGSAVVEVAMAAKFDPEVLSRDAGFAAMANSMFLNFATGLIKDGVYAAFFAPGVSMAGGGIAKMVTTGMVKEFVVKKGFEATVKKAFQEAVDR